MTDITERERWEKLLADKERELHERSVRLVEAETALRVLLKERDHDRKALVDSIVRNIRELVFPYLDMLRKGRLDARQSECVALVQKNLNDILSPFLAGMTEAYGSFTPAEICVADLIRTGKTSKEIADFLGITPGTVENHRNSIRAKLGLRNKKHNLRTYLLSLQQP